MSASSAPVPSPASSSPGLLRKLFTLNSIGFYLMVVLVLVGAAYTSFDMEGSRWYWQWLIPPVFGAICIAISFMTTEATTQAHVALAIRQVLHWIGVLLIINIAFIASGSNLIDALSPRQVTFIVMQITTLGTFLAGVYIDWRLCLIAFVLEACAIGMVVLQNVAPLLVLIGAGSLILYFAWVWLYGRWQAKTAKTS